MTDEEFLRLPRDEAMKVVAGQHEAGRERLLGLLAAQRREEDGDERATTLSGGQFGALILMVAGLILVIWSWAFDPSIETSSSLLYDLPSRVVNMGQIGVKLMIFGTGSLLMVLGSITLASLKIIEAIKEGARSG